MAREFYYVKEGASGTRTTGGGHATKKTGTWSGLAAGDYYDTFEACRDDSTKAPAAGDLVLISTACDRTNTVDTVITFADGVVLLSVDDANVDQYMAASTAQVSGDPSDYFVFRPIDSAEPNLQQGLNIYNEESVLIAGGGALQVLHDMKIEIGGASGADNIGVSGRGDSFLLHNSSFLTNTANAQHAVNTANSASFTSLGGEIRAGTDEAVYISTYNNTVMCYGTDFSASPSGLKLVSCTTSLNDRGSNSYFYRCKLPASWTFDNCDISANENHIVESCDSEYQYEYLTRAGTVSFDTSVYHDDDDFLPDGTSKGSYEFVGASTTTPTDVDPLFLGSPQTPRWLMAENTDSATNGKVRIKFVSESAETLDDKDFWVYVLYPDPTNTYLQKTVRHQVDPLASGSALSTQTGKWTGTGLGTQYYLDITMTSPGDGLVMCMVGFTNASGVTSRTVHVSPQIDFVP